MGEADGSPTVSVISWDDVPDFRTLLAHAQSTDAEIIYIAPPDPRRDANPKRKAEAQGEFAGPRMVMVVVGEGPPMLFRRSFILSAVAAVNPQTDIADVGQDLLDFANRSGYAARFI